MITRKARIIVINGNEVGFKKYDRPVYLAAYCQFLPNGEYDLLTIFLSKMKVQSPLLSHQY